MTDARKRADSSEFLDAFAHELRASGVDVARITTGVPILHPQIFSFCGLWELGMGTTERLFRAEPSVATMTNSPIRIAYEGGGPVRCDLTAPRESRRIPHSRQTSAAMATPTMSCYSVPFADGSLKALSLATGVRAVSRPMN